MYVSVYVLHQITICICTVSNHYIATWVIWYKICTCKCICTVSNHYGCICMYLYMYCIKSLWMYMYCIKSLYRIDLCDLTSWKCLPFSTHESRVFIENWKWVFKGCGSYLIQPSKPLAFPSCPSRLMRFLQNLLCSHFIRYSSVLFFWDCLFFLAVRREGMHRHHPLLWLTREVVADYNWDVAIYGVKYCCDTHELGHAGTHCNTLQHTAAHCNTLQHTATHCNTLPHTATHLVAPHTIRCYGWRLFLKTKGFPFCKKNSPLDECYLFYFSFHGHDPLLWSPSLVRLQNSQPDERHVLWRNENG